MSRGGQEIDPRLLPPGSAPQSINTAFARSAYPQDLSPAQSRTSWKQSQPHYGIPARVSNEDMMPDNGEGDDYESPGGGTHSPANDDSKRPRACEACRGLKVRCDQDPNNPDVPCKRCAKAGRQCVVTQPTRKRQKKADNRVADLERKLDALTAALHAQQNGGSISFEPPHQRGVLPTPDGQHTIPSVHRASMASAEDNRTPYSLGTYPVPQVSGPSTTPAYPAMSDSQPNKKRKIDEPAESFPTPSRFLTTRAVDSQDHARDRWDTLDEAASQRLSRYGLRHELYHIAPEAIIARIKEIVDPALHEKIFNRFVHELSNNLPAVVFPAGTKAQDVIENKPVLFLCIMTAASVGLVSQDAQNQLTAEVLNMFSECVVRHSIKSLELVEAMTVAILWYRTPEKPDTANFYMVIHMAACMALDLGLGRRFKPLKARRGFGGPAKGLPPGKPTALVDSDSIEARRAWLACYYLCASSAMSLRRPNLLRWNNYMQECIEVLESSPDAAPTDRLFAQHIRIQKICEDISVSFQMDDASATTVSILDPKVSYTLDVYEQKINDWRERLPVDMKERPQLIYFYDVAVLYLHEIAMHVNHNVDDFRLPFTEDTLKSGLQYSETLTQKQMAALEACLGAAQRIITAYCSFGSLTVAGLPPLLFFVRCVYALIVLIKMHMAVIDPGSEVGKVIKPEDIKVEEHLDKLWAMFQNMAKHELVKPHHKILLILGILREWFIAHKKGEPAKEDESSVSRKAVPHGRNPHGNAPDSKLQVLSEAATAGSSHPSRAYTQSSTDQATAPGNQNWTFDSPSMSANPRASMMNFSPGMSQGGSTGQTPDQSSTTAPTSPGYASFMQGNTQQQDKFQFGGNNSYGNDQYGNLFSPNNAMGNFDWTADMNLEQVLDGAFREFDMSGDLGGWFLGDGVGAYHIPAEGAAPSTDGLGNPNNNNNNNGNNSTRW